MRVLLISILMIVGFSHSAFAKEGSHPLVDEPFLSSYEYPFKPSIVSIPERWTDTLIKEVDILFVGEFHVGSLYLKELKDGKRFGNEIARQNSYNQENSYFNLIKKFSEIHRDHKKCLYLEYTDNSPKLNKWLRGLHTGRSHYFLINTAIRENWSIFAVDRPSLPTDDIPHEYMSKRISETTRDEYMSKRISETIQNGECEKGISVNGQGHLGCDGCLDHLVETLLTQKKVESIYDQYKEYDDGDLGDLLNLPLFQYKISERGTWTSKQK